MHDERGGVQPPRRCQTRNVQEPTVTDAERHPDDAIETGAVPPAPGEDAADAASADTEGGDAQSSGHDPEGGDAQTSGDDAGEGASTGVDIEVAAEEDPRSRAELLAELLEAEARRDEYLDDLRRARAEFENFRRRTMREGATQRDAGKADVLTGVLEVLDDLDRTLQAADGSEDASLAKGIGLVAGKLVQALQSQGLERIDQTGVAFDPNQHEAVQQVEADEPGEQPSVAQVLRPGYRVGERVLRAAMVVVEQ